MEVCCCRALCILSPEVACRHQIRGLVGKQPPYRAESEIMKSAQGVMLLNAERQMSVYVGYEWRFFKLPG